MKFLVLKSISKKDIAACPSDYPIYSSSATNNGLFGCYGKYLYDDVRIAWSVDGGGKVFYRDDPKYSLTNVCGWLKVVNEDAFVPKFLYYVMHDQWTRETFDYTRKAHPSVV